MYECCDPQNWWICRRLIWLGFCGCLIRILFFFNGWQRVYVLLLAPAFNLIINLINSEGYYSVFTFIPSVVDIVWITILWFFLITNDFERSLEYWKIVLENSAPKWLKKPLQCLYCGLSSHWPSHVSLISPFWTFNIIIGRHQTTERIVETFDFRLPWSNWTEMDTLWLLLIFVIYYYYHLWMFEMNGFAGLSGPLSHWLAEGHLSAMGANRRAITFMDGLPFFSLFLSFFF